LLRMAKALGFSCIEVYEQHVDEQDAIWGLCVDVMDDVFNSMFDKLPDHVANNEHNANDLRVDDINYGELICDIGTPEDASSYVTQLCDMSDCNWT